MTQTEDLAQFDPASFEHIPVLLNECLDGLNIDPAGTYLDGTAGGAGHSRQIALRLDGAKGGRLVSLDQDPDAVQTARARLAGLPATVVQINFRYAGQALESLGIEKINGALLDLGVSSHQLDDAARGFSYRADAPLDMRMSQQGETAADLVNTASREEISRILRDYGEEPYAWQIAGHIVEARETAPIETTLQLADIVASAMPPAERRKNKNPSRRTFQALRIAVNHELDALEEGLDTIFEHLAPGGRLCVIFPAPRALEMLRAMEDSGIAPKRLRTVQGMPGRAPKFLLIEGVRGGGQGLHWLPPLVLREADGSFSAEWKRIYRVR